MRKCILCLVLIVTHSSIIASNGQTDANFKSIKVSATPSVKINAFTTDYTNRSDTAFLTSKSVWDGMDTNTVHVLIAMADSTVAMRTWGNSNFQPIGSYATTSSLAAYATTVSLSAYTPTSGLGSNAFTSTAYYPNSNPNSYISSVPAQAFASLTGKPTTLSGYGITDGYSTSNPSGYISSVPAQTFASLTGKPTTLSGYGITDAYPLSGNPSSFLTSITSGNVTTALGYTPVTNARTLTINGTTLDLLANRTFTIANYVPAINSVTRSIASSNYTISTTLQAFINYTIQISCTASIGGAASGSVTLQMSTNSGSTWTTIQTVANSNTVTLALTLNAVTVQTASLSGYIPANALVRMVSASSGTTTLTYLQGFETY